MSALSHWWPTRFFFRPFFFFFSKDDIYIDIVIHWRPTAYQQHENQFPWQRQTPNFQVISVTATDIRWAIITFSTHLHFDSVATSLPLVALSCTITAPIILSSLCLLLSHFPFFDSYLFPRAVPLVETENISEGITKTYVSIFPKAWFLIWYCSPALQGG